MGVSPGLGRLLRVCAWVFVACVVWQEGIVKPAATTGVDFGKHWLAARALLGGASVYDGWELHMGFNYPQWMAMAFFWVGLTDFETAERIWGWMLLGLLVATWWVAWRGMRPAARAPGAVSPLRSGLERHWAVTTALMLALFQPATTCLPVGNIDPYNALLAVALAAALLRGRDGTAGVLWALLILCKLLPLSLLVVFVLWERWRVLRSAGWTLLGYLALLIVCGRLGYEWYFYRWIVPDITYYWRWISRSIPRGLLLASGRGDLVNDPVFYRFFTIGALAGLGGVYTAALGWMRWRKLSLERALEPAFLAVPLLAPLLEYHHFVLSLPTILLQLRRWSRGEMSAACGWIYLIAWLNLSLSYRYLELWPSNPLWMDFTSLYSIAVIVATMTYEMRRSERL